MGSARGNWGPRGGQQPFRPNPNGAGDCTTTLRRLLIGAAVVAFAVVIVVIVDAVVAPAVATCSGH